jgi:hypothetical protein
MSILKTTNSGSKSIPVKSEQTILDEIAKLGYTYNYTLRCWSCSKNPLPDIAIARFYGLNPFYIYVNFSTHGSTTYTIITMYDLFNFIEDMKKKYVNS